MKKGKPKVKSENKIKLNKFKEFKTTNYNVGDFLIRLKNASLARKKVLKVASYSLVREIAKVLEKQGYVKIDSDKGQVLELSIVYSHKEPVLNDIRLISKPGLRVYMSVEEIESKKGPSIFLISTPKGVMTSKEAIKRRLGGEVIAEIV